MSLLDKASLIVTPNAYKESKLYSVVPNTTLGDMDVVRATTATRVNSSGLIEVVPRNLFVYSEQFENANWLKQLGSSIVSNTTIAPNGTLTADTLNILPSQYFFQNISAIASTTYRISIYVKVASGTKQFKFNTYSGTGNDFTSSVFTATTEWQRFTYSFTAVSNATTGIYPILVDGLVGGSFFIWGAQLDLGATATEYFPTTTRLNIPRIDYTNGSCPSLLVEPQRTNLIRYSEQFDDATWAKTATTITSNTTISPSGVQNADTITGNGSTGVHDVWQGWTGGTNNSVSFFVKKGTSRYVYLSTSFQATVSDYSCIIVDLDTQTITSNSLGNVGFVSANIVSYANGWYRITSNTTSTISTGMYSFFGVTSNNTFNLSLYGRQVSSSNQTAIVWAGQAEAATYPTSYIPTVASSVTRNADVISKTGISSLIGQTEGTLFCDVNLNSRVSFTYFAIANNLASATDYLGIAFLNNSIAFESVVAGAVQANISHSNTSTGRFKIAAAYKANDFVLYINGVQIGVDTSGTIPTCSQLGLTAFNQAQALNYNSVQLYKTRLTNAELQSLTTL